MYNALRFSVQLLICRSVQWCMSQQFYPYVKILTTPSPLEFIHSFIEAMPPNALFRSHNINFNSISHNYIIVHPLSIFVLYYVYILCMAYFNMTVTNITLNSMLGFFITFFGTLWLKHFFKNWNWISFTN